jgi:hypothetical protein
MPYCPDGKRRLRRRHALDTHLPIQQTKWVYSCGGCFCELVYHPMGPRPERKQQQAAARHDDN